MRKPLPLPPVTAGHSPNRQRLIARFAVWTVMVSGAAILIPHFMA